MPTATTSGRALSWTNCVTSCLNNGSMASGGTSSWHAVAAAARSLVTCVVKKNLVVLIFVSNKRKSITRRSKHETTLISSFCFAAPVRVCHHIWRQILSGGFCMRHVMNALRRIFCFIRHDMRTHAQQKQYVNERKQNVHLSGSVEYISVRTDRSSTKSAGANRQLWRRLARATFSSQTLGRLL